MQQCFLSRGRKGCSSSLMADSICPEGWEVPADSLPSCFAQACSGVSPCQGKGSRFQNLTKIYCHSCCQSDHRPCRTEEQSPLASKLGVGGVPWWQSVSWRLQGWASTKENILICDSLLPLTSVSLVLLSSPGTSGISLSHNFYSGSIFKSNSVRTPLSPQRLPPQWLEFTRFYNCGSRVSTNSLFFKALPTWGHWQPLGAWGWVTLGIAVHPVPLANIVLMVGKTGKLNCSLGTRGKKRKQSKAVG